MILWLFFTGMVLVAIGFVVMPLYRQQKKLTPIIAVTVVAIAVISAGLYYANGSPDAPAGGSDLPEMNDLLVDLAQRLDKNPDDLEGWKMLGRSYMTVSNFEGAISAFEHAIALDGGQNAETLVALAESMLAASGGGIEGRVATLFESALAIDADAPQALFYGGIGAFNRDDPELAASRWERLLGLNPPAEVEGILRQRVAEWRGQTVAAMPEGHPQITTTPEGEQAPPPVEQSNIILSVAVSVANTANVPAGKVAFLIARDPAQLSPPIAVKRLNTSDLPVTVNFADTDSMVAGRSLSGFAEVELLVRVSMSGQRSQQSGDWIGVRIVKPAEIKNVTLVIDQQVP